MNSTKNSPQIIIHPTPNSDIDISDWKTYRNEKYGYEIKYPNDWDINSADLSSIQYLDSKYKDFYESPFTNPLSIDTIEENNKNIEGWISGKAGFRYNFTNFQLTSNSSAFSGFAIISLTIFSIRKAREPLTKITSPA